MYPLNSLELRCELIKISNTLINYNSYKLYLITIMTLQCNIIK